MDIKVSSLKIRLMICLLQQDKYKPRFGTDKDSERLADTFRSKGFDVFVQKNLKGYELEDDIHRFSR